MTNMRRKSTRARLTTFLSGMHPITFHDANGRLIACNWCGLVLRRRQRRSLLGQDEVFPERHDVGTQTDPIDVYIPIPPSARTVHGEIEDLHVPFTFDAPSPPSNSVRRHILRRDNRQVSRLPPSPEATSAQPPTIPPIQRISSIGDSFLAHIHRPDCPPRARRSAFHDPDARSAPLAADPRASPTSRLHSRSQSERHDEFNFRTEVLDLAVWIGEERTDRDDTPLIRYIFEDTREGIRGVLEAMDMREEWEEACD